MTTEQNTNEAEVSATLTPKELAVELNTDSKTVRKFLRSVAADRPGKGGRWAIPTDMVDGLRTRFEDWNTRSATPLVLTDED